MAQPFFSGGNYAWDSHTICFMAGSRLDFHQVGMVFDSAHLTRHTIRYDNENPQGMGGIGFGCVFFPFVREHHHLLLAVRWVSLGKIKKCGRLAILFYISLSLSPGIRR